MLNLMNSIVRNTEKGTLKHEVAEMLLDNIIDLDTNEEIMSYLYDVSAHGCKSGIVSGMIYYRDTEAFFNRHVDEIFDIYNDLKEQGMEIDMELSRNNLAWMTFDLIANDIYNEVEEAYEMM